MRNPLRTGPEEESVEPRLKSVTLTAAHGINPTSYNRIKEILVNSSFENLSRKSPRRIEATSSVNGQQGDIEIHLDSTGKANPDPETDHETESAGKVDLIRVKATFHIGSGSNPVEDLLRFCVTGIEEIESSFGEIDNLGPISLTYRLKPEDISLEFEERYIREQKVEIFDSNIRVPMVEKDGVLEVHRELTNAFDWI